MKLYNTKIFEWGKIQDIPLSDRKEAIVDAVMHFIKKIQDAPVAGVSGAKVAGVDTNLSGTIPVMLVMSDTVKSPDRGYELLFDEVDMRQSTNNTFEMLDVTGGVTFYQHDIGAEAKLSSIPSSSKTQVAMLRYTGGYNVLDDWLKFNQYYKIDELTADTIRRWYDNRATIFYGLLTALAAGINESYDTDDITTINNACSAILVNLSAAGYPVDENSEFVITCNPKTRGRIFKAINASFINPNSNNSQIMYNIRTVISTTKIANTTYYVSLPGGKNKRGEWEDLNLRTPQRNELMLGAAHVWTGGYNGIVGESKQHRRCSLS